MGAGKIRKPDCAKLLRWLRWTPGISETTLTTHPGGFDTFDFLLEGVATLLPNRALQASAENPDLDVLRHNAAIAGVLAFALAEHPDPLGPRQSRAEVAALLMKCGLEAEMKTAGVWPLWENGTRGRLP